MTPTRPFLLRHAVATLCLLGTLPAPASAQLSNRILRLMLVPGVSGHEDAVREAVELQFPASARIRADDLGNMVLRGGTQGPHTLVVAPLDESGFVVSAVTDDGYLRVHRHTAAWSGALGAQFLVGQPVEIATARGPLVPGVFATPSTHLSAFLTADERARPRGLDDLWLDVGARSREEVAALGIRVLDAVSLRERATVLAGGAHLAGVAATQRAAAQALTEVVLRAGGRPRGQGRVTLAWTGQSQYGQRGLLRVAAEAEADRLILLRGALAPGDDARGSVGTPGQGPIIADDDTALAAAATQAGIAVQILPAARVRAGLPREPLAARTHVIAIPAWYAHTPVESVAVADVDAAARLLTALTGLSSDEAPAEIPPTPPDPVPPVATGGDAALDALAALIATPGVSGHEAAVRAEIQKRLPAWAQTMAEVDRKGNLFVRMGAPAGTGTSSRPLLFVAHMDEVGFEITGVRDDGTATVRARGGMYLSLYEAQPMLVATAQGPVPAVLAPRPRYAAATAAQPAIEDLVLDFGTRDAAATRALGVAERQPATIRKRLQPLAGTRATGRAMDDRVGATALLLAIQQIDPSQLTREVTFAWVVEEETGLAGAQAMVDALERPYLAVAIDTFVSSDAPLDTDRVGQAPLGAGAVLRGLDSRTLVRAPVVDRILTVTAEAGVTLQVGVTSGGTDASAFNQTGAIDVGLSWPGRYSHSPVEVMDRTDLGALVKAIVALAKGY